MKRFLVLIVATMALWGDRANADVTYDFEASQASYSASSGQSLQIPIYLHEALTNGSTSQITADGGLFSFGISTNVNSGGGQITALDRNPTFDQRDTGSTTSFPTTSAKLWAEQNANFPNGPTPGASDGRILLATLTFQAPATGTSQVGIGDFNGPTTETLTYASRQLDALISTGAFTVTVVPEPASLAVCGALTAMFAMTGRRPRGSR